MKRLVLMLFLFIPSCGYQWANGHLSVHARRAAQQLCQAQDLHAMLHDYGMTPATLERFCKSVGWPLELNEAWEHGG